MHKAYFFAVFSLGGHLVLAGAVFFTLFTVTWLVSFGVAVLNSIHPFDPAVLRVVGTIEFGLMCLDSVFSLFILVNGMVLFCRDVMKEKS